MHTANPQSEAPLPGSSSGKGELRPQIFLEPKRQCPDTGISLMGVHPTGTETQIALQWRRIS